MRLILVRHALPEQSEQTDDPDLGPEGRRQAEALATALAGEQIDAIWTSPMRRAVQTAAPLAGQRGLEPQMRPDLVEFDFGHGVYIPAENRNHPVAVAVRARMDDQRNDPEIQAFQRLVVAAIGEIVDVAGSSGPHSTAVVVCHGGVVNAYASHVLGTRDILFSKIAYTGLTVVHVTGTGRARLVSLNEHQHVRAAASVQRPGP